MKRGVRQPEFCRMCLPVLAAPSLSDPGTDMSEDNFSVRKLKRVAMMPLTSVDLAETGHLVVERAGNDEPGTLRHATVKGLAQ
jgi:hypothetical protein